MIMMNKKNLIIYVSAALCCILIAAIAALNIIGADHAIYSEERGPITIFFQTDAGTYLSAVIDRSRDDTAAASSSDLPAPDHTVNINTASADELDALLPGIGEKKAAAIVEYRRTVGRFRSVDELIEVNGISRNLMEKLRPYCRISDSDALSD